MMKSSNGSTTRPNGMGAHVGDGRIILLTTFRKERNNQRDESGSGPIGLAESARWRWLRWLTKSTVSIPGVHDSIRSADRLVGVEGRAPSRACNAEDTEYPLSMGIPSIVSPA